MPFIPAVATAMIAAAVAAGGLGRCVWFDFCLGGKRNAGKVIEGLVLLILEVGFHTLCRGSCRGGSAFAGTAAKPATAAAATTPAAGALVKFIRGSDGGFTVRGCFRR